jgi:hypothetical protein
LASLLAFLAARLSFHACCCFRSCGAAVARHTWVKGPTAQVTKERPEYVCKERTAAEIGDEARMYLAQLALALWSEVFGRQLRVEAREVFWAGGEGAGRGCQRE